MEREIGFKRLVLLPDELKREIAPQLSKCRCFYSYLFNDDETDEIQGTLRRIDQGIYVDIRNIPDGSPLVQLRIDGPGFEWISPYTSLHNISINFERKH